MLTSLSDRLKRPTLYDYLITSFNTTIHLGGKDSKREREVEEEIYKAGLVITLVGFYHFSVKEAMHLHSTG